MVFVSQSVCQSVDISLAHPWSTDSLKKAAKEEGAAAKKREREKSNKYLVEQLPGGGRPHCIALVYEHFGHWGEEAELFLKQMSRIAKLTEWNSDGKHL